MRKIVIAFLLVIGYCIGVNSFNCQAQDIILTRNNSIIEANVLEVGDKYVIYTPFNDKNAKPQTIEKSELKKISYADGKELDLSAAPSQPSQQPMTLFSLVNPSAMDSSTSVVDPRALILKSGKVYNAEGQRLTVKTLAPYLSPKELSRYKRYDNMDTAGMWIGGIGLADVGVCYLVAKMMDSEDVYESGVLFGLVGGLLTFLAGIMIGSYGGSHKDKIINQYNQSISGDQACILSIGPTKYGYGLALYF